MEIYRLANVIDLYAGAGGLSLGAIRAGFDVAAAVEIDPHAISTHVKNFPNVSHVTRDVSKLSGTELLQLADMSSGGVDGLIGGPPCQGFSFIGKRKVDDGRNDLFVHFFRMVSETRPTFFLAENVPGILNAKYDAIRSNAFDFVREDYVLLPPIKVKASDYGAPTNRVRIFFFGYDPKRMKKNISHEDLLPPKETEKIFVRRALMGLPIDIDPKWTSEEEGWRKVESKSDCSSLFGRMINDLPKGVGDPFSLERYFERNEVSGCIGTRHTSVVVERFKSLSYGEQDRVSRAVRLDPDNFCPTLRAGTGIDKGSFSSVRPVHYAFPRVITPREAARLQGFPDWFVFHPTKWHSFRQIGNSVSPIVSQALLTMVLKNL